MKFLNHLVGGHPALSDRSVVIRLGFIMAVVVVVSGGFAYAGGWLTPRNLTQARIVDRLEQVNGVHPGFRRNHAKGLCLSGSFKANGTGTRVSRASLFVADQVTPVRGRIALAGGQPYAADAATTVRSLAIDFLLPDGQEWRTGINNIPVFPVRTPKAFYDQLLAAEPDPTTGQPNPERLKAFFADHPESVRAAALIKMRQVTSGYADSTFRSLNTFRFVSRDGTAVPVRWAAEPVGPVQSESAEKAASGDKNYLFDEFAATVLRSPVQWRLVATLGMPNDPTTDATLPWPAERERIDLGTLTISSTAPEAADNCRDINFDPLVLPDGIEPSDDPILSARSAAYADSFRRREGEKKSPSAIAVSVR
jgi:catalase